MSETKETKEEVKQEGAEVDLDFEVDSLGENPSDEDKDKAIKTLSAQKAHWRKKHDELVKANEDKGDEGKDKDGDEAKKDEEKKEDTPTGVDALPQSDVMALIRAEIPEEDIPEVVDYAQMKGISVAEALKAPLVKTLLETNAEKRTVEEATNTGKTSTTKSGVSDEELLENAKKGIMPDNDADMDRLAKLRLGIG